MTWFVRLRDKRFSFERMGTGEEGTTFAVNDVDGMKAFCREQKITDVMCSSSVDFPEEAGLGEDFDAHEVLGDVLWTGHAGPHLMSALEHLYRALQSGELSEQEAIVVKEAGRSISAIHTKIEGRSKSE